MIPQQGKLQTSSFFSILHLKFKNIFHNENKNQAHILNLRLDIEKSSILYLKLEKQENKNSISYVSSCILKNCSSTDAKVWLSFCLHNNSKGEIQMFSSSIALFSRSNLVLTHQLGSSHQIFYQLD